MNLFIQWTFFLEELDILLVESGVEEIQDKSLTVLIRRRYL